MKNGNYALRLPVSLKKYVEEISAEDGTTINQFIVSAVAEKVSVLKTVEFFAACAKRAELGSFDRIMSREGGQSPQAGDEIWRDGIVSLYPFGGQNPYGGQTIHAGIEFPEAFLDISDKNIVEALRVKVFERNLIPVSVEITLAEIRSLIGAPGKVDMNSVSFSENDELRFDIHRGPKGFKLKSKKGGPESRHSKIAWLRENLNLCE